MNQQRTTFGSQLGILLASVGCAVGLGNIWRFPYMLGTNGGAAFLLVYVICILMLGVPVLISEFFIGRYAKRNTVGAFAVMAPGTKWSIIGYNGVLAAFFIAGFYYVLSGWTLDYIFTSATTSLEGKTAADFSNEFEAFSSGIFRPVICTLLFIGISHYIVVSGVKNGIERASKILMPIFFLILIVMCIRSATLSGAGEGFRFLFQPDFSKINSSIVLSATGQAFFSLSLGMGCMITYGSYFGAKTNLQKTSIHVTLIDTFVSILGGILVFPAVFHFGIEPTAGVELVFITLPNILAQLPFSNVWAVTFFILLAVAAITSTIALHEVATAYLHEEFKISRKLSTFYVTIGVSVFSVLAALSFGILKEATIFGLTFFELLDYLTAKVMLPFGGMLICIFVGNRVDRKILKAELTNKGSVPFYFFNTYCFVTKYVAPIAIGAVFLNELGLFKLFNFLF